MIATVIGARPQFIKAAVVSKELDEANIEEAIIHTGQHYDEKLSDVFWKELNIPKVSTNLAIGSGTHGYQTARMIEKIEQYLTKNIKKIKAVLVYGDTNSTLAGALAAAKLNIKIIHVEAGLRSFNKRMPEEVNRIVTDRIADVLFCSSEEGVKNLQAEGITSDVFNTGDVMYDAVLQFRKIAKNCVNLSTIHSTIKKNEFFLITIHRPSNTDNLTNLKEILYAIGQISQTCIWPVHPRNRAILTQFSPPENLILVDPLSYFEMLVAIENSKKVITDSGGLQKEAYWLQKPCITLREETEWIETLNGGWNILTGPHSEKITEAVNKIPQGEWLPLYGNGTASKQIASIIKSKLNEK